MKGLKNITRKKQVNSTPVIDEGGVYSLLQDKAQAIAGLSTLVETEQRRIKYLEYKLELSTWVAEALLQEEFVDNKNELFEKLAKLIEPEPECGLCYNGFVDDVDENGEIVKFICPLCTT